MDIYDVIKKYRDRLAVRRTDANKSDYGKLLVIGGSPGMAGAAFLSGLAAFRAGMGMVRYLSPEENRPILQTLLPEAMVTVWPVSEPEELPKKDANLRNLIDRDISLLKNTLEFKKAVGWATHIVAGPGLSTDETAAEKIRMLLEEDLSEKKLVLFDADALNIIAKEGIDLSCLTKRRQEAGEDTGNESGNQRSTDGSVTNIVITPHIGEMARLTGLMTEEILKDPAGTAAAYSKEHNCVTVLKNYVTNVSSPSGDVCINRSGHPAMAKAGSGDVLTGVIAGMTAVTGANVFESAAAGIYIHGRAGTISAQQKGAHSVLAREIAENVSEALKEFENEQSV